jgi:hypothetical protein
LLIGAVESALVSVIPIDSDAMDAMDAMIFGCLLAVAFPASVQLGPTRVAA